MYGQRYDMCVYDMHSMTHVTKHKINVILSMYNLKISLIPFTISSLRRLWKEITSLKNLRVYSCLLFNQNWKRVCIDVITFQMLRNLPRIKLWSKHKYCRDVLTLMEKFIVYLKKKNSIIKLIEQYSEFSTHSYTE